MHHPSFIPIGFFCIYIAAACVLPLWTYLSHKISKKVMFNIGMSLFGCVIIAIYFVHQFSMLLLVILFLLAGVGISTIYLGPWSMVPDTVEYSEWKTGLRREGIIYGFFYFSQMVSPGIAAYIMGFTLRHFHYVADITQHTSALMGIRLLISLIPLLFVIIGWVCIAFFPINHKNHQKLLNIIQDNAVFEKKE